MPPDENHIAHGTPDALREFIAESLSLASIQADLGVRFAEVGDDTGMEYALRRLFAYAKAAVGTLADLKAEKLREEFE